jgi:hypothetical protein
MGIFSGKNKFVMNALRIKERGSKNTPSNFSDKAVNFMKGMPGYYPEMHETDATGKKVKHEIDPDEIQNITTVEGEGGRKMYGEILGEKEFVGEKDEGIYDALQKELDSGFAKKKGFTGTDVKEYEQFKLDQMEGDDVKQEKIEVEKEIKDDTLGKSITEIKEVERQENFFEGFENQFEIDGTRGENKRLQIPVTVSSGKIDFKDNNTMKWLNTEEGEKVVNGMSDMMGNIQEAVKNKLLKTMSDREKQLLRYGVGDINRRIDQELKGIMGIGPNDARGYGISTPIHKLLDLYTNDPDKLQKIIGSLGLTQEAATITEQQEVESSTPGTEGYETNWRQKRD